MQAITVGIDLAAEGKRTGGCLIRWRDGRAAVESVKVGMDDEEIVGLAAGADAVGIDSPFGWPTLFAEAIAAHQAGRSWPASEWNADNRSRLRLRRTDRWVQRVIGIQPLSVSSDRIAIPATRCAGLLDRLGVKNRSGDGRVFEVYPAAALRRWGFRHRGYKGRENASVLRALLREVRKAAPWLTMSREDEATCAMRDDAFDALVASLIARAAAKGLTARPEAADIEAARVEGWIALPGEGSFDSLL